MSEANNADAPKNTVATIAASINKMSDKFLIKEDQVCVTNVRQEGDKVRAFYTVNRVKGMTEEEAAAVTRKVTKHHIVMVDPFKDEPVDPVDPVDPTDDVLVESITVSPIGEILVGAMENVTLSVLPADASDPSYTAVSADPTIAEVVNGGATVAGKKAGLTTVTYTANDASGKSAVLQVKVVDPVVEPTSIEINLPAVNALKVNDKFTVGATVLPANATVKDFTVTTSDASVLAVSGKEVTVKKVGKATITVTTTVGGKTDSQEIEVKAPVVAVTGITIVLPDVSALAVDDTFDVGATIAPAGATDKTFTVSTSDATIISVAGKKATVKKAGKATITVTSTDGAKTDSQEITVA